ncbi:hypothetical protein RvY_08696-2 [Ramazzottius varieornatus]|uniref:Uncharacterized protein n=1 Tax=Ramazzottius varieornatus TaxID=947166 RepID=A0A1D1V6T5_RAMVA|nr:hypothetical protein RvY_08696-2 [Ramazzottius varieornatus]
MVRQGPRSRPPQARGRKWTRRRDCRILGGSSSSFSSPKTNQLSTPSVWSSKHRSSFTRLATVAAVPLQAFPSALPTSPTAQVEQGRKAHIVLSRWNWSRR